MLKVFKTYEIDDALWQKITEGFNEAFDKNISNETLKKGYCTANVLGYGYHAVDIDDKTGEVRGFHTYSPAFYTHGIKAVIGGSTYVRKKYRKDAFIFFDLDWALREAVATDGYQLELGVPNHNSKEYSNKVLNTKNIGNLHYYILPRNLSRNLNKNGFKYFDGVIRFLADLYCGIHLLISGLINHKEKEVKYSLEYSDAFLNARFHGSSYKKYEEGHYSAYYTIVDENGAKVAYLMDFREKSQRTKKAMVKATWHISRHDNPDAILFVGMIKMRQHLLLQLPYKMEPKHLPLIYYILNENEKDKFEGIDNPDNWDFSLINFDVR